MEAPIKIALNGHTALVCGASQGIGMATSMAFAEAGCEVVALARSEDKLKQLVEVLPGGKNHRYIAVDITEHMALQKALREEIQNHGPMTILVNNTGGPAAGPITEATGDDFRLALDGHVIAAQIMAQALLPGMKDRRYGRIINVLSTSVYIPIPNLGVSNTIRAAMAGWAKTLSMEVGAYGITVNNVLPGYTETPRLSKLVEATAKRTGKTHEQVINDWKATIPAQRFASPDETASAIAFLASPLASYINGISLAVDGGRTGAI